MLGLSNKQADPYKYISLIIHDLTLQIISYQIKNYMRDHGSKGLPLGMGSFGGFFGFLLFDTLFTFDSPIFIFIFYLTPQFFFLFSPLLFGRTIIRCCYCKCNEEK